eukprot:15957283-Heterocapsa_arctica.AAC.1
MEVVGRSGSRSGVDRPSSLGRPATWVVEGAETGGVPNLGQPLVSQRPPLGVVAFGIGTSLASEDDDGGPMQLFTRVGLSQIETVHVSGDQDVEIETRDAYRAPS